MKYSVKAISDNANVSYENESVKAVFDKNSDNASFALKIDFSEWENDAYVFMPACVYDGNRFPRVKRKYPPMYTAEEMGVAPQPIITEVPALNPDGSGKIEVNIGDLSVPCVGVFYRNKKEALLLFTEQECKEKNVGFCVEKASVMVQYPVLRSTCYRMCRCDEPSTDSGFCVTAGEVVTSKLVIKTFSCESITEFFKVFFFSRKTLLSGSAAPNGYTKELWNVMEAHFNTENWSGEYYAEVTKKWQCGWVGGGMSTLALYKLGGELSKKRALQTLDYMTSNVAQSGFFYTMIVNGERIDDGFDNPNMKDCFLVRKNGDALYYLFKHFEIIEPKRSWIDAARACSDAFVRLYERYGTFGQFVNIETGEMMFGGTTSGASAIGALAYAYKYFGDARYLEIAKASGEKYYRDFIEKGLTYGGPGEALCCPDSESSYAMVESMTVMYEVTEEAKWLEYAKDALHLFSSWVMPYSYRFPDSCEFGRLKINTVGSVFANVQNKHSAPGACTASGDAIYKIYKYTGEEKYLELIKEIAFFIPQCVSTEERPIYTWDIPPIKLKPGDICERVNTSDWGNPAHIGGVFNCSCWCESSLILSYSELMPYFNE